MDRALREFRIRGVATNLVFLENVINHPQFLADEITTRFIDTTPQLLKFPKRRDRATRLLRYIADVTVNGNPEVIGRPKPSARAIKPTVPSFDMRVDPKPGTKQLLDERGPEGVRDWMLEQSKVLITDTTMRDAHQSLLATCMRSYDMIAVSEAYAHRLPNLFSLECWGGATFDVSMRFLNEDPWDRLTGIRESVPNTLLQMLLSSSNAVGYTNYPDNAVRYFVEKAADAGIDVFRVFDSLNWVENMKVAIEAVLNSGRICEAAICYTGDFFNPDRSKYDLNYYVSLARELKASGAHILGIKDMGGLCRPEHIRVLVKTLKEETGLPIHFHTHDTSGISAATVLAACEVGVDAVDAAMDSFSGLTSQPNMGSIVAALNDAERGSGIDPATIRAFSDYWEAVRAQYAAFEPDLRAGASEVYLHEMPGGQFTNLKEQSRSLGLADRWHEVARMYAEVNQLFGDIVKVTPSSKVVGDMALYMVAGGVTPDDVLNPSVDIAFPSSVVSMLRGDIGQPPGGWPEAIQKKALHGEAPITDRPANHLSPVDLTEERSIAEKAAERSVSDFEVASSIIYPTVFADYAKHRREFGRTDVLPTPVFFYGMTQGQEISVDIDPGKTLVIRLMAVGEADERGEREMFFELNGQSRVISVSDRAVAPTIETNRRADLDDPTHVAAPMPSVVSTVVVSVGQHVEVGDVVLTLEAMKMEAAVTATVSGQISALPLAVGTVVDAKDLLAIIESE